MKKIVRMRMRERGVAVITALLLTTLAITIVASLFWQQQVQVRSIENQRLQLQKQWIIRGAIDWARLILKSDAQFSSVDHLDEPWATPLAETKLDQYVENGSAEGAGDAALSGGISDAQARLNLTNLCVNGAIVPGEVLVFGRLLSNLGLNSSLAQATAELMAKAQRKNDESTRDSGQPLNLLQAEDLLAVPGFSVEMFSKLRDFVIVLPRVTPVNVNTASVEVLAARLGTLSDATTLIASRKQAYIRDLADLTSRLRGQSKELTSNEVSVATNFFLVNGNVRLSRAALQVQSLVERNSNKVTVIWIREI
jgi:general secretion pathway protein K